MSTADTIAVENAHMAPFFSKTPVSIARGEGVWVWDEEGTKYLDLTAGWGVTSIGHAHPAIRRALTEQGALILQNPDSGSRTRRRGRACWRCSPACCPRASRASSSPTAGRRRTTRR